MHIIENKCLKLTFDIERDRIKSFSIYNKLSGKNLNALSGSEVFSLSFESAFFGTKVNCSDLKILSTEKVKKNDIISESFIFKPFKIKGSKIPLKLVYEYSENLPFMKKYLSFNVPDDFEGVLEYIDFGGLKFHEELFYWTVPKQKNSHISSFPLSLGQPVYVDSLFFGVEFPVSLSKIEEGKTELRYYSGKMLKNLSKSGVYESNRAVIGSSVESTYLSNQRAFFSYVESFSRKPKLRVQYNSWYDHMLDITDKNVRESFLEIEKGLMISGEKPIDSYVVDDGWNDYGKGFWSFNEKFKNELYPYKNISEALGSNFGLWLGPRGGYTSDTVKFAREIERHGNGYVNRSSGDICVASKKYIEKTADMMLDFQRRFNINYWKLDGFARKACKNPSHDHITGGHKDMYFYTELWENWIDVFERLKSDSKNDVFINLTSYAWPSPWFLKYVDALWIQTSDDMGFIGDKKRSAKDRLLTYRDEKYYEFYRERKFQCPPAYLYNHDPIYGNEGKVTISDREFKDYLFTMAGRGNAFWELYYSHNLMNEKKWRINHSALSFIRDNLSLLSKSVQVGSRPKDENVYAYCAFSEREGIVTVRNASGESEDFVFHLTGEAGVSESLKNEKAYLVYPYKRDAYFGSFSFGDELKIHLLPHETKIIHIGKKSKPLEINYLKVLSSDLLEISFNQVLDCTDALCGENGIKNIESLEDQMTFRFAFERSFERINSYKFENLKDVLGNALSVQWQFDYYDSFIVSEGLYGKNEFSIKATLDKDAHGELYSQENLSLSIFHDHVRFVVGLSTLVSFRSIDDVIQITALRERNGLLKLYLNGELDSSAHSDRLFLRGERGKKFDDKKVVLLNKAPFFDEV